VAITGDYDYDFQLLIEELAVGAQFKLPYVHVLVNNSYLGLIRQSQRGFGLLVEAAISEWKSLCAEQETQRSWRRLAPPARTQQLFASCSSPASMSSGSISATAAQTITVNASPCCVRSKRKRDGRSPSLPTCKDQS
jgi:hypothetical protein